MIQNRVSVNDPGEVLHDFARILKKLMSKDARLCPQLRVASTLSQKRVVKAEDAGHSGLCSSLTTQSTRFWHASRRAGAILAHCRVALRAFGPPNPTVRALPWAKIIASDVHDQLRAQPDTA